MARLDLADRVADALGNRIGALDPKDDRDAITARVLQDTRQVLRDHDGPLGTVGANEPGRCKGCGEDWPCPTLRNLHKVYVEDRLPPRFTGTQPCAVDGCPGTVSFYAKTSTWQQTHIEAGTGIDHIGGCDQRAWLRDPATGRVIGFDEVLPFGSG